MRINIITYDSVDEKDDTANYGFGLQLNVPNNFLWVTIAIVGLVMVMTMMMLLVNKKWQCCKQNVYSSEHVSKFHHNNYSNTLFC